MQSSIIVVLLCLVAVAVAVMQPHYPAVEALHPESNFETIYDSPVHERSHRNKRGLLLLKKKLLLGALGLKAAKVGVVGAGVAGALALKKKPSVQKQTIIETHPHPSHYGYISHGPAWNVEVHRWH